jgi:hypothetical protein
VRRHAKAIVAISALLLSTLVIGVTLASATAPTVTLESASAVTYTSAHVTGKVDPQDKETTYFFQYTADPSQGWRDGASQGPLAAGSGETAVSDDLTNLKPGTGYFVRLVAESSDGQTTAAKATPLFTTQAVPAPTVTLLPPSSLTSTGAKYEAEINPGGTDPVFEVRWHFVCTPGCVGFNFGSIAADNSTHQVSAKSEVLKPNTTYELSLVTENAGGETTTGPISFTTPARAPQLLSSSAKGLRDEANLNARIHPGGLTTTYHFEYGPTAAYGSSTPTKTIGGSDPVDVEANIAGLAPESTYHFHVVAENSLGAVEGPDRSFTTIGFPNSDSCANAAIRAAQGVPQVGDCRAFEMVSPEDKNGADVSYYATQSAPNGNAVAYQSSGAFSGAEGSGHADGYISRRTPEGWQTEAIAPLQVSNPNGALVELTGYEMFTSDLSEGILMSWNDPGIRTADPDAEQRQFYLRTQSGQYLTVSPPAASPSFFGTDPIFIGASEDLTRVFFESSLHLTPDAPAEGINEVYEWVNGEVNVVGVLPDGTIAPSGATTSYQRGNVSTAEHKWSVSPDGSDVVFQSGSPEQIYLRSDGSTTTPISLSQKSGSVGDPAPTGAKFLAAVSADGKTFSKLYFTSSSELTNDAFTGPGQEGSDLYAYDVASGELTDLTANEEPQNPLGARVESEWLAVREGGRYLYFVADGALLPGVTSNLPNLYVLHDGQLDFVRPFSSPNHFPYVSATGRRALIFSNIPLTGEPIGAIGSEQAFIYDQPSGDLTCASCQPVQVPRNTQPHGFLTGYSHPTIYEQHNISADGRRAFFETSAALVPQDTNGEADVYEWENGTISLVSTGRGAEGAHFLDASPSGDDVFIATGQRILPTDRDSNLDVYDARVNGGLPLPPTPGAPCEGDACQSPPSPPNDATPASAGFSGPGNAKPRFAKPRKRHAKKAVHRKKRHARKHGAKAKHRAHARTTTRSHG